MTKGTRGSNCGYLRTAPAYSPLSQKVYRVSTRGLLETFGLADSMSTESRDTVLRFEVFMAVTMKSNVFGDVIPRGSLRTDVSEKLSASIIRVTIGELGTTSA
jgi:hypothetical protein